ncbi:MAG: TrkH family potassium uptake protein, partial [Deferribacteraceae bacterium]|nr:TrkH family potassium uptake protein [Deferribacteraceae bacterium]
MAIISVMVGIFILPCVGGALYYGEMAAARAFITSIILLVAPSIPIIFLFRNKNKAIISARDGFLLVFFAWLSASICTAVPFYISDSVTTWGDAFFEAASGISTTGATVINDIEAAYKSIVLWRSIANWMGGMGIVVLSVALMPLLGIGGMQLFRAEATGRDEGKLTPRIAQTAKILWVIYTCFTIISFVLLRFGGMTTFEAINHALTTMASGGFSSKNNGMAHFQSPYIQWVTMGIMFISGLSFSLIYRLFTGKIKRVFMNTEIKAYIFIIIMSGLALTIINSVNGVFPDTATNIRMGYFHAVSMITSTGYATTDFTLWPALSQYMLFILMLVGGCAGSTSGGLKVVRIVVMLKQALNEMRRLIYPHGVFVLRLNGAPMSDAFAHKVAGFFFLYTFSVLMVMFVVSSAGLDLFTSFTTGLAVIGNIGTGFGMIGPSY